MGACASGGASVSPVYALPLENLLEALQDGLLDLAALGALAQEVPGQPPNDPAAVLQTLFPLALKAKADKRPSALEVFDLCSAALLSNSGETLAEFVTPKLLPQLLKAIGPARKTSSGKEEQLKGGKELRRRILCETLNLWVDALPEKDGKTEKMVQDARARLECVGFIEENLSTAASARARRHSAEAYFKILSDHAKKPRMAAAVVRAANADGQLGQLSLLAAETSFRDGGSPSKPSLFEAFLSAVLRTFGSSLCRQIGITLSKTAETLPSLRKSPVRDAAAVARDAEKVVRALLEDLQQHWNRLPLGGLVVVCDLIQTLQGLQEGGQGGRASAHSDDRPARSPGKQRSAPPPEDDTSDSENEAMARLEKGGAGSPMLPLGERCAFELVRMSVPTKPLPKQIKVHSAWMKHVIPLVFAGIAQDGVSSKALKAKVVDEIQKVGSKLRPVSRATLRELAKHAKDSELASFCGQGFLQRQVSRDLEILKLGAAATAPEEQQTTEEEQKTAKEEQKKKLGSMFGEDEDDESDEEGAGVRQQSQLAIMQRTESGISEEIEQKLLQMFRLCDVNGDGMMSKIELIEVCRHRMDVAAFFGEDGSGQMMEAIFEHIDADEDGYVSWDELLSAFEPEELEEALHRAADAPHVHGSMFDGEEEDDDDEDQEDMMHHRTSWDADQQCGDEDGLEALPGERSKAEMLSQSSLGNPGHKSVGELTDWQEEAEEEHMEQDEDLYAHEEEFPKELQLPEALKQQHAAEGYAEEPAGSPNSSRPAASASRPDGSQASGPAAGAQVNPQNGKVRRSVVSDQMLREIFNRCDRNGDGRVNKRELIKVCADNQDIADMLNLPQRIRQEDGTRDEFERIFQGIDANQDREIDWPEFKAFCVAHGHIGEAVSSPAEFADIAVKPSEICPETAEVKHMPATAKEPQAVLEIAGISQAMPADSNSASRQAMLTDTVAKVAVDSHPECSAILQAVPAGADMTSAAEKNPENINGSSLEVSAPIQAVLASPSAAESKPMLPAVSGTQRSAECNQIRSEPLGDDRPPPPPALTSSPALALPKTFTDQEIQSLICSPSELLESAVGGKSSQVQWSDGEQSGCSSQPLHGDFQVKCRNCGNTGRDFMGQPCSCPYGQQLKQETRAEVQSPKARSCSDHSAALPEIGLAREAKVMYSAESLHPAMGSGIGMSLTEATHLPTMESTSSATPGGSSVSSDHSDSFRALPPGASVPLSVASPKQVADDRPAESQALEALDVPVAASEPARGVLPSPAPAAEPLPTAAAVAVPEASASRPLPTEAAAAEKAAAPQTPGERSLSAEPEATPPKPQLIEATAAPEALIASGAMLALYEEMQRLNQRTATLESDNKQLLQHLSVMSSFYEQPADSQCEETPARCGATDVEQHLPIGPSPAQEQQHNGLEFPQGYDCRFAPQPRAGQQQQQQQQRQQQQQQQQQQPFWPNEASMQRAAPPRESPRREPSLAPGVFGAPLVNISFGGTPGEQSRMAGGSVEGIRPPFPPQHSMNMSQAADWSGLPPQHADPSGIWSGLARQSSVDASMLPAPFLQRTMMPAEAAMLAAAQGHGFVAPGPQHASGAQLYYPLATAIPQPMPGTAPPQQVVLPAGTAPPQQVVLPAGTAPPQQVVLQAPQVYSTEQTVARQQSAPPLERPAHPLSRTVLDSTLLSTPSSVSTPIPPQDHNFRLARTSPLSKASNRNTSEMVAALVAAATQQDASKQQQRDEQSDREWVKSAEASLLTVEIGSEVRTQIGSEVRALASELRLAGQAFTSELQSACDTFQSAQRSLMRQSSMPTFNKFAHSDLPSPHQMNSASTYSVMSARADWPDVSNIAGMSVGMSASGMQGHPMLAGPPVGEHDVRNAHLAFNPGMSAGMSASGMQGPPMLSGPPLGVHDVPNVQVPPHASHSMHVGPPVLDLHPSLDYSAGIGVTTAVPPVPLPRSAFLPSSNSPVATRGSAGRRAAQPRAQPSQPRASAPSQATNQNAGFAGKLRKLDTKLQSLDARFRELG